MSPPTNPPSAVSTPPERSYLRDIYSSFREPKFSTNLSKLERLASQKLNAKNFGYIFGSANQGRTCEANIQAFDRYRLRPRMLVDATRRDIHVELFGIRHETPLIAGPVGVQELAHPDAEEATVRACRELKIPFVLSTAATRSIEQIADAGADGHRWFQLYWPRPQDDEITISLLERAKQNGYTALVVTLDTFQLGWRPTDLDRTFLPFLWGQGNQIPFSDPVFTRCFSAAQAADTRPLTEKLFESISLLRRPGTLYGALQILLSARTLRKSNAWLETTFGGVYRTWADLAILKSHWSGPIMLKGIQTVQDAHLAIEHGIDGIIVSNHGGRQIDGAIASLDALVEIAADSKVRSSGIELLFDSGIRTGSDVLKALALGAKAVLIGRPFMWGLAIGGEEGVRHVFRCLLTDVDVTLGLMGKKSLGELSRDDLQFRDRGLGAKL